MKSRRLATLSVSIALLTGGGGLSAQYIPPEPHHNCVSGCNGEGNSDTDNTNNQNIHIPPSARQDAFVAAACMYTQRPTAACRNQNTEAAAKVLGSKIFKKTLWDLSWQSFEVYLPLHTIKTAKVLYDLEMRAIEVVQTVFEIDLESLQPFQIQDEESKRQALLVIQNDERTIAKWNREARAEASRGTNWERLAHTDNTIGYRFNPGPAYEQLANLRFFGYFGDDQIALPHERLLEEMSKRDARSGKSANP
ncbi:hypothetical protein UNPF46_00590 [Bradyrhizobium sp. UNPF46]|uniref:hypothetical protein n=1 Tax=Bradyrhizobium sp. UNPF46 TaxID=1141168 RepID=UPI00114F1E8D|nr:hypothetical protein [Bradyrhizobium sp. UNPF46]TQF43843.1 hypothetical protein UNPF46_00590 [Bradyrhizobium sp. UNPF46]